MTEKQEFGSERHS